VATPMLLNYQIGSYNPSPSNASLNPSVRLDQIEIESQSDLKTYDYVPITPESLDRVKGLDKGASGADRSKTGTVWDSINATADDIPDTKIPATFQVDLDDTVNYTHPETGTNTLWTNSNATKHMGEYTSRFGEENATTGVRSQAMLESYQSSLNSAMQDLSAKDPGRYYVIYGDWELGINTETGVVYHALMK